MAFKIEGKEMFMSSLILRSVAD